MFSARAAPEPSRRAPLTMLLLLGMWRHSSLLAQTGETPEQHADKALEYARAGDLQHAEKELRRAVELAPQNSDYLTSLGGILGMEQKPQEAGVFLEKAVKANPNNRVARRNLAANQWQSGRLREARENLERLLKTDPHDQPSILLLGMVSENLKDYARAAQLLASVEPLVEQRPESIAALASAYYHTNNKAKARVLLTSLPSRHADPQGVFLAAGVAGQAEDYETAATLLQSIRSTYPDTAKLDYNLALVEYRGGHYPQSQKLLLDLVSANHSTSEIYNLLGWNYEQQNHAPEAIAAFQEAIRLDPARVSNYLDLCTVLTKNKRLSAALAVASRAAERFTDSDAVYQTKGLIETKLGQFTDAVRSYGLAVKLNPASLDANLGLASAQWAAGLRTEAAAGFEQLMKRFPRSAVVYETYGSLLVDGSPDEAAETHAASLFQTAITLDNSRAESHFQIGNAVLKKETNHVSPEQLQKSLMHLELARRLAPTESKIHYALSRLYRRLGRADDAAKELLAYQEFKREEDK